MITLYLMLAGMVLSSVWAYRVGGWIVTTLNVTLWVLVAYMMGLIG